MYEHIPGLRKRTRGETLSQNGTVCLHASQTTCQRGTLDILSVFLLAHGFKWLCVYCNDFMVHYPFLLIFYTSIAAL